MAAGGSITWRVALEGAEQTKRALSELGPAGARGLAELERATTRTSTGLRALNAASGVVQAEVAGLAGAAGPAGVVLGAMGPAGLAAAAGIGAFALAAGVGATRARDALQWIDELGDSAQRLGVSTEALTTWRFAAEEAGLEASAFDTAIAGLSTAVGQFVSTNGGGRAAESFRALGFTPEQLQSYGDVENILPVLADRFAGMGSESERAFHASRLGVRELLPLLVQGSDQIEEFRQRARDLGLEIDSNTAASMGDLARQAEVASQVIDTNLRVAFLNLGPTLVWLSEQIAGLTQDLNRFLDRFRDVNQRSTASLRTERTNIRGELLRLNMENDGQNGMRLVRRGRPGTPDLLSRLLYPQDTASRRQADLERQLREIDAQLQRNEQAMERMAAPSSPTETATRPSGSGTRRPPSSGRASAARAERNDIFNVRAMMEAEVDQRNRESFIPFGSTESRESLSDPIRLAAHRELSDITVEVAELGRRTRQEMRDAVGQGFADGTRALMEGRFGDWLGGLLNQLADRLMETAGRSLFDALNNPGGKGQGGAGGGWVQTGLNFAAALFRGGRASGGPVGPGGWYLTGERGPELVSFSRPGHVFDAQSTQRMLGGGVTVSMPVSIHAPGADAAALERVRGELAQLRRDVGPVAVAAVRKAQDKSHGRLMGG